MTLKELTQKIELEIINEYDFNISITKPFSCDLLSVCMSKASSGCVWVTVMGNVNAVAVATLTDCACIILAEGANLDDNALNSAKTKNVNVLRSTKPIFETALEVHNAISI
ncbi:MAG: hypothetical protein LBM93_12750 [Oscillospiraceae bacterium]|jgi:hypothetical protein|nr:hypothetical protein [Oscillospiraceae bacterium]